MTARLRARELGAYSALAFPLAMAALPIYIHVPRFYSETLGLNLASVGLLLLFARAFDAIQDPLLGYWSDRRAALGSARRVRMAFAGAGTALLAAGIVGLFNPPEIGAGALAWWLGVNLFVVYFAFSMATISYQAFGAELATDPDERTRITAVREGVGLIGVFVAAALPQVLAARLGERAGFSAFSLMFVPVALLLGAVTVFLAPRGAPAAAPVAAPPIGAALLAPLRNALFRPLLAVFMLNGIASAVPASLVLFFIGDVIARPDLTAQFLIAYFAAGACGMPLWARLSARFGKARAWLAGMVVSILAFVWAFLLGPGDALPFFVICVLSGLGLGADLAIPPSLLADVIDADSHGRERREGAYFGLWNLVTKLNLALAAGISLPLLALSGYTPNGANARLALTALAAVYALVPCALKAGALLALARSPFLNPPSTQGVSA